MTYFAKFLIVSVILIIPFSAFTREKEHHHKPSKFMQDLTEAQRDTIQMMIDEMKVEGKAREEVHEAVKEKLQEYGIPLPSPKEERTEQGLASHNYPNPFQSETTISFKLPDFKRPIPVTILIYDLAGKLIKSLTEEEKFDPGENTVIWDSTDDYGSTVKPATYLYVVQTIHQTETNFMIKIN